MFRWFGVTLLISGASAVAISACSRDAQQPQMMPAAQVSPAYSAKDAAEMIAAARCDREQRCNNIGPNLEYQNRQHCMNVFRNDATETMADDEDCRRGVKPEDLNECMSQLRGRSCGALGAAFDSVSSTVSCRSAELCMD